jgi:WD40 repeat protein
MESIIEVISPDASLVAKGFTVGVLRVERVIGGDEVFVKAGHMGPISTMAWSESGRLLATGGLDGLVAVWEVPTGRQRGALQCHGPVSTLKWLGDRKVASGIGSAVTVLEVPEESNVGVSRGEH